MGTRCPGRPDFVEQPEAGGAVRVAGISKIPQYGHFPAGAAGLIRDDGAPRLPDFTRARARLRLSCTDPSSPSRSSLTAGRVISFLILPCGRFYILNVFECPISFGSAFIPDWSYVKERMNAGLRKRRALDRPNIAEHVETKRETIGDGAALRSFTDRGRE
jgi:hypothetical protein